MAKRENKAGKRDPTSANVGYEAQPWQMADAQRGSMDASENKHVVLGLNFLEYFSHAFEEQHAQLVAEQAKFADPEDSDEYLAQSIFWAPAETTGKTHDAVLALLAANSTLSISKAPSESGKGPARLNGSSVHHRGRPEDSDASVPPRAAPGRCSNELLHGVHRRGRRHRPAGEHQLAYCMRPTRRPAHARVRSPHCRRRCPGRYPHAQTPGGAAVTHSSKADSPRGEVVVYEAPDGEVRVDVRLERETVWLTQQQMADLFRRERSVVTKHVRNVFQEGELEPAAARAKFAHTAADGKTYQVDHYSLDVVISVGYRVKSLRGTQFRIWATNTLREHLLRGYTLNERRLRERGLSEIEEAVGLLARTLTARALITDEGRAVLDVVQRYTRSWRLLLEYDEGRLAEQPGRAVVPTAALSLEDARATAASLRDDLTPRGEAGPFFGQERGEALAGILGAIEQTFGGEPLYPSAQARAAHLLYFVIKDHPFGDGNKRLGTLFFLEYLRRNGLLLRASGEPRLPDNAMVALALLIAESEPAHKDLMIRLVLSLMEDGG